MEGMWPMEELKVKGKELELEGWRAWEGENGGRREWKQRSERYWKRGTGACWHGVRDPGWLRVDYAAWKVHWAKTQRDREGTEGETGAAKAGTGAGSGETLSWDAQLEVQRECRLAEQRRADERRPELFELAKFRSEGWKAWKEGRAERFQKQGYRGKWSEEGKWLQKDDAVWKGIWGRAEAGGARMEADAEGGRGKPSALQGSREGSQRGEAVGRGGDEAVYMPKS